MLCHKICVKTRQLHCVFLNVIMGLEHSTLSNGKCAVHNKSCHRDANLHVKLTESYSNVNVCPPSAV